MRLGDLWKSLYIALFPRRHRIAASPLLVHRFTCDVTAGAVWYPINWEVFR